MLEQNAIDELKRRHGTLREWTCSGETVIVREPTKIAYDKFRDWQDDPIRKGSACEAFVTDCVVYPDASGVMGMLERKPGLADTFAIKLSILAGNTRDVQEKKL
jgi:hypothetical protein